MNEEIKKPKETSLSFKHWLSRTVIVGIILVIVIIILEYFLHIPLVTQTLLALGISVFLGLSHEMLHYAKAVQLKYKTKWYRTRLTMGFEIEHQSIRGKETPEKKKIKDDIKSIGTIPYIVLVPLSILIGVVGWKYNYWGLELASGISLFFHTVMYPKEGKPFEKKRMSKVPADDGTS